MRQKIRRVDDFKRLIAQAYWHAEVSHWTHTQLLDRLSAEVYQHADYKRLTRESIGYLYGYVTAKREYQWQNLLVWRLGPVDGPLPEDTPESERWGDGKPLSTLCRIPGALYGGHFWKGTDKAFDGYRCTNEATSPGIPEATV